MQNMLSKLKEWQASAGEFSLAMWDSLPDIELYMDQVITYIEKQLQFFQQVEEVKLITPSMINNYVKDEVIKHAVQKKYNREHLASLIMVGLLKQVLPISKIKTLLGEDADMQKLYNTFLHEQSKALNAALEKVDNITKNNTGNDEEDRQALFLLAMSLSAEAFANRIAAEKLLNILTAADDKTVQDKKLSDNTDVTKAQEVEKKQKAAKDKEKAAKDRAKLKQKQLKDKAKAKAVREKAAKIKDKQAKTV